MLSATKNMYSGECTTHLDHRLKNKIKISFWNIKDQYMVIKWRNLIDYQKIFVINYVDWRLLLLSCYVFFILLIKILLFHNISKIMDPILFFYIKRPALEVFVFDFVKESHILFPSTSPQNTSLLVYHRGRRYFLFINHCCSH